MTVGPESQSTCFFNTKRWLTSVAWFAVRLRAIAPFAPTALFHMFLVTGVICGTASERFLLADEPSLEIAFRIVWGGAQPRSFAGSIAVDHGQITVVQNLNLQPDAAGCIRANGNSALEVLPTSPTTFGGVDVLIAGSAQTQLVVSFVDPVTTRRVEKRVLLGDLINQDWLEALDERGTQVAISRPLADRLRIKSDRDLLIFDAAEPWRLSASGVRTGLAAGEYELHAKFVAADSGVSAPQAEVVHPVTVDQFGSFPAVEWDWSLPPGEGTYLAEFTLNRKRFVPFRLSGSSSLTRRLEVVVLDASRRRPTIAQWQPLFSVDLVEASQPGSVNWLAPWNGGWNKSIYVREMWNQVPLASPTMRTPISHGKLGSRFVQVRQPNPLKTLEQSDDLAADQPANVECLTIAPQAWLALPVNGLQIGKLHRLRVYVPTDQPLELATSVRAAELSGELPPLSRDTSIVVHHRQCSVPAEQAIHEMLFWPTGNPNYVMLVNPSEQYPATILQLEVEQAIVETQESTAGDAIAAPTSLASRSLSMLGFDGKRNPASSGNHLTSAATAGIESLPRTPDTRLVGLYLDKPILIDSFSAGRAIDSVSGRELDSWNAWMEAVERLEQVMNWTHSNTLTIKVAADGAAIYPSQVLAPTLRYESGIFFADGRAPMIKDAVELLLRRFDREGQHLILAIDIDSSLPGLADANARQPSTLQRNLAGTPHATRDRPNNQRYNPLDPSVQRQLSAVVDELLERYSHHPAFRGIAIQLDRDSQFTFAGDRWGLDSETLRRFASETGATLPDDPQQLERILRGELRASFLQWRATHLSAFYGSLSERVISRRPDAHLVINPLRLWEQPPVEADFWDVDLVYRNPDEYLLALGVDAAQLQAKPGLMLLQGRLARNPQSVLSSDWMLDLSSARAVRRQSNSQAAAMILQQPVGYQVDALDELASVAASPSSSWIFPFAAQPGDYARQPWIDQLYESDCQMIVTGGWLPAGGQEAALAEFHRAFGLLPPVLMRDITSDSALPQNVRVRQSSVAGKSYLQLINNAPWPEELQLGLQFSAPEPGTGTQQTGQGGTPTVRNLVTDAVLIATAPVVKQSKGVTWWPVALRPFDLLAIEVGDPRVVVVDYRHQPLEAIGAVLSSQLQTLEQAVAQSGDPTSQIPLAEIGGDFEQWTNDSKPRGWNVSSLPDVNVGRATELPHSGRFSLSLENRSTGAVAAWIQSEPLAVPRTRRLTLQAWLRQSAAVAPATVRLSIRGRLKSGERFEKSQEFGGVAEGRRIANDWGHRPATLSVGDLPPDLEELQVAIDLIGPGKIWIDDVEVFESLLRPDERIFLRGQLLVARQALEQGNPYPAEKLLDSHWSKYISQFYRSDAKEKRIAQLPTANAATDANAAAAQSEDERGNWNQSKPFFQQWRDTLRDRWRR